MPSDRIPDDVLMLAAREGDADAFAVLFRRWHDQVFRVQFSRLRNEFDADEATADTFSSLFQYREKFTAERTFRPWLFLHARYARLRLHRRRPQCRSSDAPVVDRQPRPADIVERQETAAVVRERMADIVTPAEAEAIQGVYYDGRTAVDVAATLRITHQGVHVRLNTAMKWLRHDATLAALC